MIRQVVRALLAATGAFLEELYPKDSAGTPAAGNDPAAAPTPAVAGSPSSTPSGAGEDCGSSLVDGTTERGSTGYPGDAAPEGHPIFSGGWGDTPDELTHGPGDPKDFIHRGEPMESGADMGARIDMAAEMFPQHRRYPSPKLSSFPD